MCTAIHYSGDGCYFGRNFDFHMTFGEKIVLTPRRIKLSFIHEEALDVHPAIIGTAVVSSDTALYFDGMNEYGICAAALNFPSLAVYRKSAGGKVNIASFEVIPYLLSTCRNMSEVCSQLEEINVTDDSFSPDMPATGLHWMISDGKRSVVLESMEDGVHVYEAETGVLTNPPEYSVHLENLQGLTGYPAWDYSSASRFLKASQIRKNYTAGGESGEVSLFKMLGAVSVPKGSVIKEEGVHYTKYTAVCDTMGLVYHRSTYENMSTCSVRMKNLNLEGSCHVFCEG